MNKFNPQLAIPVFFVFFAAFSLFQNALELKKEHEWDFEREVQYYIINGEVHVWSGGTLCIFRENQDAEEKIKMRRGEGPGDHLIINKIVFSQDRYLLWDRQLKRLNYYSPPGKLLKTAKFKTPIISSFIGLVKGDYIFKWSSFEGTSSRRLIKEQIGIISGDEKKTLLEKTGVLNKGSVGNYDRPMLLYTLVENRIYYADNREYKIYTMHLGEKKTAAALYAAKKNKPLKWQREYEDIQWDLIKKPRQIPESSYPKEVPPLFVIAACTDLLAAVTNEQVLKRKAVIDIFRNGKHAGSAVIPILHQQHFVFPGLIEFPPDIYLFDRWLYTFHYFDDLETYKIIKWKIIL